MVSRFSCVDAGVRVVRKTAGAGWWRHALAVAGLFLAGLGAGYGYVHYGMPGPVVEIAGTVESYCRSAVSDGAAPEAKAGME